MIVLDTSSLVRFFTNDEPEKAKQVDTLLESDEELLIPDVVFPELEYILTSQKYKLTRKKLSEIYKSLVSQNNIITTAEVRKAAGIYENSKLDMADCIIAATVLINGAEISSFDRDLLNLVGAPGFEPGTTRV